MDLAEIKQQARKEASLRRKEAAQKDDGSAIGQITDHFLRAASPKAGSVVSGFLPIGSELDLRPMLARLTDESHLIVLPCVVGNDQPLVFRQWMVGDPLVKESFGTVAPADSAPEHAPDILLVPMLAFDRKGYRLGYGGGFYDRSLQMLREQKKVLAVGVAYSAQEVDAVPHDNLDQPLDMVVTEQEVIRP